MTPCHPIKSRQPAPLALLLTWLLALALMLSPAMGLVHGVLHTPLHSAGQGADGLLDHSRLGSAAFGLLEKSKFQNNSLQQLAGKGEGWLESIFPSHKQYSDCRLYDQASHGSALTALAAWALPVLIPSFAVAIFQGKALARWAALFEARGPPLTR